MYVPSQVWAEGDIFQQVASCSRFKDTRASSTMPVHAMLLLPSHPVTTHLPKEVTWPPPKGKDVYTPNHTPGMSVDVESYLGEVKNWDCPFNLPRYSSW